MAARRPDRPAAWPVPDVTSRPVTCVRRHQRAVRWRGGQCAALSGGEARFEPGVDHGVLTDSFHEQNDKTDLHAYETIFRWKIWCAFDTLTRVGLLRQWGASQGRKLGI